MTQILVSSTLAVLAFGAITVEDSQVVTPQGIFPIDVIEGYAIIEVELPEDFVIGPAGAIWDGHQVLQNDVPVPEVSAPTRQDYEAAVQAMLDEKTRALFAWRDAVTVGAYQVINAIMAGQQPAVPVDELLALMPQLEL